MLVTTKEVPFRWMDGRPARNHGNTLHALASVIYSYGAHFPIARRVIPPTGDAPVYLVAPFRHRSVTTS